VLYQLSYIGERLSSFSYLLWLEYFETKSDPKSAPKARKKDIPTFFRTPENRKNREDFLEAYSS
jgi:hypothetical protein